MNPEFGCARCGDELLRIGTTDFGGCVDSLDLLFFSVSSSESRVAEEGSKSSQENFSSKTSAFTVKWDLGSLYEERDWSKYLYSSG